MNYEGALYRPPSESQSLLLQVTVGCSYNRCTFCAMYDQTDFKVKPLETILADIKEASAYRFKRIFLCDGDALIAPTPLLVETLSAIRSQMPWVERVGIYADPRSILRKSLDELRQLRDLGLGIVYHGIESGDDEVLTAVRKGATASQAIEAGKRIKEAGIQYSAIVMLGIGGRTRSREHAVATARALNAIQPDFVGVLTTMVVEGTPLYEEAEAGLFRPPSRLGLVEEMITLLRHLELERCLLTSKHASNYLSLRVILPYEKEGAIAGLQEILDRKDETLLKPEYLRGL